MPNGRPAVALRLGTASPRFTAGHPGLTVRHRPRAVHPWHVVRTC